MNKDSLSTRMKEFYENRTKTKLPRRTYTIIRIDGKAFHTYTRGLERPFDREFVSDMNLTAQYLCENIQGAKLAFIQSDEISIILTDFDNLKTEAWFDGNIQKMTSVSASLATSKFNQLRIFRELNSSVEQCSNTEYIYSKIKLAEFDSRVFTIPSYLEVENYLIWRQRDTVRNSITSVAQSLYSDKELHGKNTNQIQEMSFQKGINWNNLDEELKRGRVSVKIERTEMPGRTEWSTTSAPDFNTTRTVLFDLLPKLN